MKYISIWRHAKAERPDGYEEDFDRPLTERGQKDALRIGTVIAQLDPPVDLIVGSPSARTAQTAQVLISLLNGAIDPAWDKAIYLAPPELLLNMLKALPNSAQHVVVVGHNPGMEEVASGLCGSTPEDAFIRMPTAALAHVVFDVTHWSMIRWGGGQLRLLVTPRVLR